MADVFLKDFLNTRLSLRQRIVSILAGGGTGWSSRWAKVMVELSKMGHNIPSSAIDSVESCAITPYQQSEAALQAITNRLVTAGQFASACEAATICTIAADVRKAIVDGTFGVMIQFDPTPSLPAYHLGTELVASPPLRPPTRKRLASPIERLEDEAFLLTKVPFVDEQDPPTLKSVEFELLGAYKGYAAAKKEANARLEEDIAALGGDESKVQHLYTIWSFRAHASGTQREAKDRTKEAAAAKK